MGVSFRAGLLLLWVFWPLHSYSQTGMGEPLYQLVPPQELYSVLPQSPVRAFQSDQQVRGGANSRVFILGPSKVPQLLSLRQADIDERGLISSPLPNGASIGEKSLFYIKDDVSSEFVFTNNSRTEVYYASNAGGFPNVHATPCTGFSKISDIHLVELNGTLQRLIVADQGANRVYSYVINTGDADVCTNEASLDITGPVWIRSPNTLAGDTVVYIGSQDRYALNLSRYRATDFNQLSAPTTLSNFRGNSFGVPFVDSVSNDLFVPIRGTRDTTNGDDHVWHYVTDFSDATSFRTCRSPDQVLQDFEGVNRYRYVFCASAKQVYVYDNTDERVAILPAGNRPVKMFVGSDGTDRYIGILQKDKKLQLHSVPNDAEIFLNEVVSVTLDLPVVAEDAAHFGALDELMLISHRDSRILFVDFLAQNIRDDIQLPLDIQDLAIADGDTVHFISKQGGEAYNWVDLGGRWYLRAYEVGDEPVQAELRGNLLYVLNQASEQFSVVNLTTGAVTNLDLDAGPRSFDFNAALNLAWVANEEAESYRIIDITGGAEALGAEVGLNIAPQFVRYVAANATLYFAGGSELEVVNRPTGASVKVEDFDASLHGLVLVTGGVQTFSRHLHSSFFINRTTRTATALDRPAHFLTSDGADPVLGSYTSNALLGSEDNLEILGNIKGLFSSASFFMAWEDRPHSLQVYPYALAAGEDRPSIRADLAISPDRIESDANDNIWIADSTRRLFQRLSPAIQPDQLRNKTKNLVEDIAGSSALERLYSVMRNANFFAVTDLDAETTTIFATCERPSQVIHDSTQGQVFVLCPSSRMLVVYALDGDGDPTGQTLLATGEWPEQMAWHPVDNLLFVSHSRSSEVYVYDTTDLSHDATIDVQTSPRDMYLDVANDRLYIASESSEEISIVNTSDNSVTELVTGFRALDRIVRGGEVHALSRSLGGIYHEDSVFVPVDPITTTSFPAEMEYGAEQNKIYVSYPLVGAVKVMDEDDLTDTDIDLDLRVKDILVDDTLDLVFLSAPEDDTIVALDAATDAIDGQVELSAGCQPGKMQVVSFGGNDYLYVACRGNDTVEQIDLSDYSLGNSLEMRLPEL